MGSNYSRREVLRGSAAAVAGLALAKTSMAEDSAPQKAPDGKLRFGIIGCGGKGWSGMMQAAQHGEIAALADIDVANRAKAMTEFPRANSFDDYRELLLAMKGKIDAVVISVPDHHHAPAAALAMRMGLHCYCEKPLARTIWEARQLGKIAREKRVATQMGNQSTASTPMRKVAALIKAGHFGAVKEVHLWTDRAKGWWDQGVARPKTAPIPKGIDWEMWLGPRPEREYAEGYHPFKWRGWWDFGTGSLGDMGCHIFNMPHTALDLSSPIAVTAQTSGHNKDSFPAWAMVHYEYAATKDRPAFSVHWYDGGKKPSLDLAPDFDYGGNGTITVCEKGTIFSYDESNTKYALQGGGTIPDIKVDESPGHMAEFARAALGGPAAKSNFPDYASGLAEAVLLGNLAIWADGPRLEWDAKKMQVKGTNEYDHLIRPDYRKGFGV